LSDVLAAAETNPEREYVWPLDAMIEGSFFGGEEDRATGGMVTKTG
jgi:hypothetical protein